jgi:hypothetical protein
MLLQAAGPPRFSLLVALGAFLVLGRAAPAHGRAAGFATASCDSCHRGGAVPKVTLTMMPPNIDPGGTSMVTVTITAVNGGPAGFFLHARGFGTFQAVPGSGTRLPTTADVVHAGPKAPTGDVVTFQTMWTAPAKAGSYSFEVWGVASNGNNQVSGDGATPANMFFTVGCPGVTVYVDFDGDGWGSDAIGPAKACDMQPGYVLKGGDCNDYRASVHPEAPEICDEYDNDCNGKVNEGLEMSMVYRDADGDGHGSRTTADIKVGCGAAGYATLHDDCNDNDPEVFAGAKEICNNKDDNCNGRVDEGARLTCGVGWCRSVADTCVATMCTPGDPRPEKCNLIDDDCDGQIDNGATCEGGRVCATGRCLMPDDARAIMEAMDGGSPPVSADGGGGAAPSSPADGGASEPTVRRRAGPGCHVAAGGTPGGWALVLGLALAGAWLRKGSRRPS